MSEQGNQQAQARRFWATAIVAAVIAAVVTIAVAALLVNIFERQREAEEPFFRIVEVDEDTVDPAVWGQNWPLQYEGHMRTDEMEPTRYGGSEAVPRTPDDRDPRTEVPRSRLEADPRLEILYAGYPFAVDTREDRGHAYMLDDATYTRRQEVGQLRGYCLHCHSSVHSTYRELGGGDTWEGFLELNPMPYDEAREHVEHPVSCVDCHDPETMAVRVTRPAFKQGIANYKASQGIDDYDVNRDASRQEMRSFACAQCHATYYFQEETRELIFPWSQGVRADEILEHYQLTGFAHWTHGDTGADMLKVQHPEYEMFEHGIHGQAGVSCADCHMPYERVGAMKVSNHQVRSPLLNIARSCQTCHSEPEEELRQRVHTIQDRNFELNNLSIDAVANLIQEIIVFKEEGASDEELEQAREHHRKAQFYADFVESANSMGFHSPQESARVASLAINHARRGQMALRDDASEELLTRARPQLREIEPLPFRAGPDDVEPPPMEAPEPDDAEPDPEDTPEPDDEENAENGANDS